MRKQEELIKLLLAEKLITEDKLVEFKKSGESDDKFESFLIKKKIIDPEDLAKAKAKIYNMPHQLFFDKKIDQNILNLISLEAATNYRVVVFDKVDNKIMVGITDPDNYKATEAVNFLAKEEGFQVEYYLISDVSFAKVAKQYKDFKKEIGAALKTREEEEEKELSEKKGGKKKERKLEEVTKAAPVAKIVSVIIRHAVEGRASDIHIEPTEKESRVRYRIDGVLHTSLVLPKNVHNSIAARIKVLASLKLDETRIPQDGRIRLNINGTEIDFRVSILPLIGGEKVVMRILDTTRGAPTLEELGYDGRALRVIKENIKNTNGMFLVTGPTGSGKSTTLFAILNMLNKDGINISTLEDPVEYFIKGVNQAQIRPEVGFTFASGLRSFLRQDPDVIMVGEVRDDETAELAVHAALTGHFVLSTLHTNNSIDSIPRLLDMKLESFLLGSTLKVIIAQRLARKICSHCKQEDKLPDDVLANMEKEMKNIPEKILAESLKDFKGIKETTVYRGVGCPRCGNSGYSGRIAVVEVFDINDKMKTIIMDGHRHIKLEDAISSQSFITMKQDGIIKVLRGDTTIEEVLRVTES